MRSGDKVGSRKGAARGKAEEVDEEVMSSGGEEGRKRIDWCEEG